MTCPCGSDIEKDKCCVLIHNDISLACTAEQLMRARYTAYTMHHIDFIYESFHPTTRRFQDKIEIKYWAQENRWTGLEIINFTKNTVEFKAHYLDKESNPCVHHEKSTFKEFQKKWYYLDGIIK